MRILDLINAKKVIELVQKLNDRTIIYDNFMKAFKKYSQPKNRLHYLYGNYRVPATISGRPTSSKP